MHFNPQFIKVSIIQTKPFGPLDFELSRFQCICCGPHSFREDDFLGFNHFKSMGANDPRGMANLDPRGMVGRIYKETTKHCYILNLLALGLMVSKKKIFECTLAI